MESVCLIGWEIKVLHMGLLLAGLQLLQMSLVTVSQVPQVVLMAVTQAVAAIAEIGLSVVSRRGGWLAKPCKSCCHDRS